MINKEKYLNIQIDGDVSLERVKTLINLQIEEEKLDFKETLDISEKARRKQTQIELTCDIISMANTYGGYIIIGVAEKQNSFEIVGITNELEKYLKTENISDIIRNYVGVEPSIKVKSHKIDSKNICVIFIGNSFIPIPFSKDGQYFNGNKQQTKFRQGEVFVRHSSKSERADHTDWMSFSQSIRKDERRKNENQLASLSSITNKMDKIIHLLGGKSTEYYNLDLTSLNNFDLDEYFFALRAC